MLLPRNQWLAVKRLEHEHSSPLWIPPNTAALGLDCCVGVVLETGMGRHEKKAIIPHEAHRGDRIIYSSRVDQYRPGGDAIDLIEDNSVIGVMA